MVIAIISLLVSILLPSLKKAKALAQSAACMSNLSSIGTGMAMYASEYDDMLPDTEPTDRTYVTNNFLLRSTGPGDKSLGHGQFIGAGKLWSLGTTTDKFSATPDAGYIENIRTFYCPADTTKTAFSSKEWCAWDGKPGWKTDAVCSYSYTVPYNIAYWCVPDTDAGNTHPRLNIPDDRMKHCTGKNPSLADLQADAVPLMWDRLNYGVMPTPKYMVDPGNHPYGPAQTKVNCLFPDTSVRTQQAEWEDAYGFYDRWDGFVYDTFR